MLLTACHTGPPPKKLGSLGTRLDFAMPKLMRTSVCLGSAGDESRLAIGAWHARLVIRRIWSSVWNWKRVIAPTCACSLVISLRAKRYTKQVDLMPIMFELDEDWSTAGPDKTQLHLALFGGPDGGLAAGEDERKRRRKRRRGRDRKPKVDDMPAVSLGEDLNLPPATALVSIPDHVRPAGTTASACPTGDSSASVNKRERKRKKKLKTEAAVETTDPQEQQETEDQATSRPCKRRKPNSKELTSLHRSGGDAKRPSSERKQNGEQKRQRKNERQQKDTREEGLQSSPEGEVEVQDNAFGVPQKKTPVSKLHSRMSSKMEGARFRWINEQLYTTTGGEASELFQEDPNLFTVYHQGFAAQVAKWPVNPLERIIAYVRALPAEEIVSDFGCGEAKLLQSVPHMVHSFDLVASNDHVTACDMAHTPLPDSSVDVAIFCLSLMGTNVGDFVSEARRVLREGGRLKVCEVASRFDSVGDFVGDLEAYGFRLISKEMFSKMFVDLELQLVSKYSKATSLPNIHLKPCFYKKR